LITTMVEAVNAKPGKHKIGGAQGLYLRKTKDKPGAGGWVLRYRDRDKQRDMGLGSLVDVSLAEARKKVHELRAQRGQGHDPIEARRQKRATTKAAERIAAKRKTFREAAEAYCASQALNPRQAERTRRALTAHAFPLLGDLHLEDITSAHIAKALGSMTPRAKWKATSGMQDMARAVRGMIEAVFDAAVARGEFSLLRRNPADWRMVGKLYSLRRTKPRQHHRALELERAPAFFRPLIATALEDGKTRAAAFAFQILTAKRPSEAFEAQWSEIDLERRLWTIPFHRTKTRQEIEVPLSSFALSLLERQSQQRVSDYVFPNSVGRPFARGALYMWFRRGGIDIGSFHGWRSTFRDWAGDIARIDRDVAEVCLGHALKSVEAAYRRRTALEEQRKAFELYGRWLMAEDVAFKR
jgi:integrase